MTALLTDNLPLLAGAPNGIKKLRELILELAVRGKLVPQDPNDEPASELLKRIAEEKARLVAEGKIKKPKSLPDVETLEKLYDLPAGWEWTTLPGAASYQIGKTPPTKEARYWNDSGLPWVSISDMEHYGEITETSRRVSEIASKDIFKYQPVPAGTLLMSFKLTVGKVAILGIDAYHNEAIISLSPYNGVSKEYLFRFLPSIALGGQQKNALMGNTLNSESMAQLLIPMPPLAEQHRIIAKVEELMALCDRLEAQQADAENAHTQLVQALLDSLTQASDATDFATNWQRLAEHFHTLFTTEPSIDALKQTLLQLAVMGRLAPQYPSDEPASELLKRIAEEKVRLFTEGKIKKQKAKTEIAEEEKTFELPDMWEWVRLGEILSLTSGKGFKAEEYSPHGARLFQIANVSLGYTKWEVENFLPENYLNEYPELVLKYGDVLIALNRPLLNGKMKVCIISEDDLPAILYQRVGRFSFYDSSVEPKYFYYYLQSNSFIGKLNESLQGSDQPFINQSQVVEFLFSLPPLAEQHRIVAKVDQLMALCDQLKTRLTQARQLNEQLASTLVEQAVA